jgi:arylsulfatase A-like enzyme
MSNTLIMKTTIALVLSGFACCAIAADKPNILVILADDLGYGELGCQGNPQIPTPHIDSIAKNGVRFTNGYVTAPICGPSRAGLLTGRYQQQFGFEGNLARAKDCGLARTEKTIADRLRAKGYATGMFGKWHLGHTPQFHPTKRGFDWFFGFLGSAHPYQFREGALGKSLLGPAAKKFHYSTDAFGAEAAAFIEKHRAVPWFVYLPFNAVHVAWGDGLFPQDSGPYRSRFPDIANETRRNYAGMESAMDDAVGVVLARIRKLGLEKKTLIFFTSDNGGPRNTTSSNAPLRGNKGQLLEGGIREPFCVQWQGHLPAGKVYDHPVSTLDILPTALAAAGAPVGPKLEGVNLLPYLTGEKADAPHAVLCWRLFNSRAIRMGDWKLLDMGDGWKLYNLATDIAEKHDLSQQHPAKVKELQAAYDQWNDKNIPPRWDAKGNPLRGATKQGTK